MTTAIDFMTRQLATTGWAPIHQKLAEHLCPDLVNAWRDVGAAENSPEAIARRFPRTQVCRLDVEGFGTVTVLAASDVFLAERVQWITGGQVSMATKEQAPQQVATATPAIAPDPLANAHIQTAEGPRTCTECDNITAGHTCGGEVPGAPSGYLPAVREPRRCIAFAPKFDNLDGRTGKQLWPELARPDAIMPTGAGAIDAAKDLLARLLASGPRASAEILAAAEDAKVSMRTMQRAADALGVGRTKTGFGEGWIWALPSSS